MKLHQLVLFTLLALGGVATAEAHCYQGERVILEVGGIDRIGTQVICDGQLARVELEPLVVVRPSLAPPRGYFVAPPAYVRQYNWQYSPPTYDLVQPYSPPAVYLGRGGVSVNTPGLYFEFGGHRHRHH